MDHLMQNCNNTRAKQRQQCKQRLIFPLYKQGGRGTHVNTPANKAGWHVVGICGLVIHMYLQSRNLGCYVLRNHWQSSYLHWFLTRSHTYTSQRDVKQKPALGAILIQCVCQSSVCACMCVLNSWLEAGSQCLISQYVIESYGPYGCKRKGVCEVNIGSWLFKRVSKRTIYPASMTFPL